MPPASSPDPVLRRLRPLEMNLFARAHVRGVRGDQDTRKALMSELSRNEAPFGQLDGVRRLPGALAAPDKASPGSAASHPPPGPRPSLGSRPGARPAVSTAGRPAPGGAHRPGPGAKSQTQPASAPPKPLLRQGAGYPLPPWLSGIRLPDIPIRFSSSVYRYLAYYRTDPVGRAVLAGWLGRMKRFENLIRAELGRHKLPQALLYVSMIESGFRPTTVSRAGAAGLWQFMAHGGSIYGLARSFWVDERFNPDRSTRAVMYYLKDLHQRFGNWELALAAYNAGYGSILRAVGKYNTNDYYRLSEYEAGLPYETMAYVPKFFAIAVIAENLERFELAHARPAEPWGYALVAAPGGMALAELAKLAGVQAEALKELNPELLRSRIPPGPPYEVRVPPAALATLRAALAARQVGHRQLGQYTVRQGDSVASIARDHRTTVALIERINDIRNHREVRPGVVLLVPSPPPGARPAPEELRVVALPEASPPSPEHRAVFYPVVAGDQLATVAKALGVTVGELLHWNDISADTNLLPGLVLRAFLPKDRALPGVRLLDPATLQVVTVNSPEFHEAQLDRQGRRRRVVRARPGDTLKRIAARTGVSVGSLARTNKLARNAVLRPGQPLVFYTDSPKGRARPAPRRRAPSDKRAPLPKPGPQRPSEAAPPERPAPGASGAPAPGPARPSERPAPGAVRPAPRAAPPALGAPRPAPRAPSEPGKP